MTTQESIRKQVTNEIVTALKSGDRLPWIRPWTSLDNTGLPTNAVSSNPYSGVNVLLLMLVSDARGYQSKYWATFNQWRSLGFQITKRPDHVTPGAWGTHCILFKPVTRTKRDRNGAEEEERFFLMRNFVLFNAEQVSGQGIEAYHAKPRSAGAFVDFEPAEETFTATGADIRHGGNDAFYRLTDDYIQLPPKEAFQQPHHYYSTLAHELCHWTGHGSRLNRIRKLERFGSESYALEELCAELGSAFLCAEIGIPQSEDLNNRSAYLASWLQVLENDHNAIFTVSSAASAAANFILSFSRAKNEPSEEGKKVEATVV